MRKLMNELKCDCSIYDKETNSSMSKDLHKSIETYEKPNK